MFTSRAFLFTFALVLCLNLANAAQVSRPYAPELFDRASLSTADADDEHHPAAALTKRSAVDDASQPYSPELFFRSSLLDQDEEKTIKRRSIASTPTTTTTNAKRSALCRRDGDCASSHYCGADSTCYMRLAKRGLCKRDAMCSSGHFCGAQGACLTKRAVGTKCADSQSSCADGLFCSTVDLRCKQKRSLSQSCRTTDGCATGLACLNFKCQANILHDKVESAQDKLNQLVDQFTHGQKVNWPSPSGSHVKPIQFGQWKRQESDEGEEMEKRNLAPFPPSPSGWPGQPHTLQQLADTFSEAFEEQQEKAQDFFGKFTLP